MLGVNKLLAMAKDTSGLHLIAVGDVFFQFISHSIVL
jgi:ABC-type amino acid transport system permease subunit